MVQQRPGDFLIGHTAFHVTVAPMQPLFDKCRHNISQGFKPFLLVPDSKLIGTRQIAEQTSEQQITVESIESFVSQNINEISNFNKDMLITSFKNLVVIYNQRVDEAETDKSLMIELPSNLQQIHKIRLFNKKNNPMPPDQSLWGVFSLLEVMQKGASALMSPLANGFLGGIPLLPFARLRQHFGQYGFLRSQAF